ncbi:MAG TPA: ABC transporter permease [Candidatus Acidoferrum sp.]|nr:ABC transporter permease [Candidatus Acidoferrum sp.]
MTTLWRDLHYGLRLLRKFPGFTAVAVLTLALGIGANAAIFQLIDATLLRTLPVRDPASLATVHLDTNGRGYSGSWYNEFTFPLWQQIEQRQQAFSSIAAWGGTKLNLAHGGEVDNAQAIWVSGEFFNVLGIRPFLGRLISPSDDPESAQGGCIGAVDLSYSFWQRRYGGDGSVIGKTLTLDGHPFPIVGVTPPSFYGVSVGRDSRFDVAVPVCAEPTIAGEYSSITGSFARASWWLAILGRLKPGWTLARATAQLESIAPAALHATIPPQNDSEGVKQYMADKLEVGSAANGFSNMRWASPSFYLLWGLSGFVLLIACATLANLLLARASAREREIAVRLALGAWRGRLIRQLLSESALLAIPGAVFGVLLASLLSHATIAFLSTPPNGFFLDMPTDWRVVGFTAALAVLTTLLFALAPALRAAGAAPGSALKGSGPGTTVGRRRFRLQRILVASQVSLSVVLLALALIQARSLRNLMTRNLGFQENGVLIASLDTTPLKLSVDQGEVFERDLLDRIRALPGVAALGISIHSPMDRRGIDQWVLDDKGQHPNDRSDLDYVTPGYFHTMEIPIIAGRDFSDRDTATSPTVAIVNQEFVKEFLKGAKDPIGKEFRIWAPPGEPKPYYTVVGLVRDSVYNDLYRPMPPIMYFARPQASVSQAEPAWVFAWPVLLIRSRGPMADLLNSVKDAIVGVNPEINFQISALRSQIRDSLGWGEIWATVCGVFGALALLIAAIGLYGVISYTIAQRTNEIGIRMALGAPRSGVVRLMMSEAAILVGMGLVVGLGLTFAGGVALEYNFYGVTQRDPLSLALAILILAAVGFTASFLSARRATNVDPIVALRYE